jgi:hypothetical protein
MNALTAVRNAIATAPRFAIRNLSCLSYAQGFTMWHYKGNVETMASSLVQPVTLADVAAHGFFDGACGMMHPGDFIICSCSDGGTLRVVVGTEGTVVTCGMAA